MSAATREEIIKNEELYIFYNDLGFHDAACSTRLEELRNKLCNYYGSPPVTAAYTAITMISQKLYHRPSGFHSTPCVEPTLTLSPIT